MSLFLFGVLTDTLAPASAISATVLSPECSRDGGEITCQVTGVATDTPTLLDIVVWVSDRFHGTLSNEVRVNPVDAIDGRFYDNEAGPVYVQVAGTGPRYVYLPLVLKRH